ncbi:M42 family metallopeptidase [Rapidithrix thailandica]|uniref:M42 family metallopeptidase n=1 Tax=Rapidithrix thailandica TaxID=413964 RepID=A0AAW9RPM3_9BACT
MSLDINLLQQICDTPGAPGFEKRIREQVLAEVERYVDECRVDNLGNIITVKKGKNNPEGKKIMLAAHMDEIGFMVTHIDEQGFLRFHTLGGFDPKTLTSMRVIVHGKKDLVGVMGCKPIHVMSPEERGKQLKIQDYYIDLGLKKEEVEKYISIGNPVTRMQEFIQIGEMVNGKSLDNRLSVYILLEVLKQLKDFPYDVYGVFTVQEEVGIRGAGVASHAINPDFGIAIDVTIANDTPGAQGHEQVTRLGEGTAIKIFDAGTICDYRMVAFMKEVATEKEIDWQVEILTAGGTDTAGIQRMGKNGAIAGAVSIPLRYVHQVTEMAHQNDIQASIDLLVASVSTLDQYDWKH